MFTKFKKRYKNIFLDPTLEVPHAKRISSIVTPKSQEAINVILSPSLYWVKKVSLPIKNLREVKKLLPSLFEETLPNGKYSYTAYKSGDEFFIFAYEDKKILDVLSQKGVALSSVAGVYFAQSELGTSKDAIKINASQSIYVKDDILVVVPSIWTHDGAKLDVSDIKLSSHSITLEQFGHVLDKKSLYKIGALMLSLSLLLATEYAITAKKAADISGMKDALFTQYNLKSTMMQNSAMLKKYDALHSSQMKLREYISYILALKLGAKEEIVKLSFKNNLLQVEFTGVNEGAEAHLIKLLRENQLNFKSSFKDKSWHVEISI